MREDLIMALAEDITMVMILSIVIGLVAGWFFTYLYYHSHDPEVTDLAKRLPPSQIPAPAPPIRYRRVTPKRKNDEEEKEND